ncbi:hypothetical protein J6590_057382 [Homalodisca vitripennis]|nr:hypothetical protein J6590_057382 [Homalodisca vitripennis]
MTTICNAGCCNKRHNVNKPNITRWEKAEENKIAGVSPECKISENGFMREGCESLTQFWTMERGLQPAIREGSARRRAPHASLLFISLLSDVELYTT